MHPNYKALLIGNGSFADPTIEDLRGPANDLAALQRALTDTDTGLFAPAAINVLRDRTRDEVALELERFFCGAEREDLLLFYYSGHGKITPQGGFYFCARDTRSQFLDSTSVSRHNVLGAIARCRSDRIVVILDCCHAGALKRVGDAMPFTIEGRGNYFMYATGAKCVALDGDLSPFTEVLVEALTHADSDLDRDGVVSVDEVFSYVNAELRARHAQSPQKATRGEVADLPLARSKHKLPAKLGLSRARVELRGVEPWAPVEELIEVENLGGGELEWSAVSDANWIEVSEHGSQLRLRIKPPPGLSRGEVRVYQHGRTSGELVEVVTDSERPATAPRLEATVLDFGEHAQDHTSPWRELAVHAGARELHLVDSLPEWISAELDAEHLRVRVHPKQLGPVEATLRLRGPGGEAQLAVTCVGVPRPPKLALSMERIDFGEVYCGSRSREAQVRFANHGDGPLEARVVFFPSWIRVKATDAGELRVRARPSRQGRQRGQIQISSAGGDAAIAVRVTALVWPIEG